MPRSAPPGWRRETSLAVDLAIFRVELRNELTLAERLEVVLIRRGIEPFKGSWALPGGRVDTTETVAHAARRELKEETGLTTPYLRESGMYDSPYRDPRNRVVSLAWYALLPEAGDLQARTDAEAAQWFPARHPPALAFDHNRILEDAMERLADELDARHLAFGLLPGTFTLPELQAVYEAILGVPLDKRNFRRRMQEQGLIESTGRKRAGGRGGRPASVWREVQKLKREHSPLR